MINSIGSSRRWFESALVAAVLALGLSGSARAQDCNNNGVDDATDIAMGTSEDCQPDGVPDECQLSGNDCNGDGRPDECGTIIFCDDAPTQVLVSSDLADGDRFGGSIAVSGDTAVIGAWTKDSPAGVDSGAVYVFQFVDGVWSGTQGLIPSQLDSVDYFGISVAIHNDVLVAGAASDCADGDWCGSAFVFRFDGSSWVEEAKLVASDAQQSDFFTHVAIWGNTILVGASAADCLAGEDCGKAYVFEYDGATWTEVQVLEAPTPVADSEFGLDVALKEDTAVIAAPNGESGSAHVFRFDGLTWQHEAMLTPSDSLPNDHFGSGVDVDDSIVVVGARTHGGCGTNCGASYVFRRSGSVWAEEQKFISDSPGSANYFGTSVAIERERIVVGSVKDEIGNVIGPGAAYVYEFDGLNWVKVMRLTRPGGELGDNLGGAMGMDARRLLVGGPEADCDDGSKCGTIQGYDWSTSGPDCGCNGVADACEPDCNDNGNPDDCDIANGAPDDNGNGIPDECDAAPGAGDGLLKSRYITVVPMPKAVQSLQVTILAMPQYPEREGEVWWAGPQMDIANTPNPVLKGAQLECTATPHSQVWTDGPLHLFGEAIIPSATSPKTRYEVRSCNALGTACSEPLVVETGKMGDAVSPFGGSLSPSFTDIDAHVAKFKERVSAPDIIFVDQRSAAGGMVDLKVDFADIQASLDGFLGMTYPFAVPACAP